MAHTSGGGRRLRRALERVAAQSSDRRRVRPSGGVGGRSLRAHHGRHKGRRPRVRCCRRMAGGSRTRSGPTSRWKPGVRPCARISPKTTNASSGGGEWGLSSPIDVPNMGRFRGGAAAAPHNRASHPAPAPTARPESRRRSPAAALPNSPPGRRRRKACGPGRRVPNMGRFSGCVCGAPFGRKRPGSWSGAGGRLVEVGEAEQRLEKRHRRRGAHAGSRHASPRGDGAVDQRARRSGGSYAAASRPSASAPIRRPKSRRAMS
jgi:hypothetical protein